MNPHFEQSTVYLGYRDRNNNNVPSVSVAGVILSLLTMLAPLTCLVYYTGF